MKRGASGSQSFSDRPRDDERARGKEVDVIETTMSYQDVVVLKKFLCTRVCDFVRLTLSHDLISQSEMFGRLVALNWGILVMESSISKARVQKARWAL